MIKYFLLTRFKPISLSPIFFITGQQQGGSFFLFSISYTFGYLSSIQTLNFNSLYVTKEIHTLVTNFSKASANILCGETTKGCKTVELKPYGTMISWTYISKQIFLCHISVHEQFPNLKSPLRHEIIYEFRAGWSLKYWAIVSLTKVFSYFCYLIFYFILLLFFVAVVFRVSSRTLYSFGKQENEKTYAGKQKSRKQQTHVTSTKRTQGTEDGKHVD